MESIAWRVRKEKYERFDIPIAQDGGIADLLSDAAQRGRGSTARLQGKYNPHPNQVFNRGAMRSKRGNVNDPVKWVWSPNPIHEPPIPKWM
ncbi:hypothetical protein [Amycolatopsis sp. GM8]|uniref:hypothetical protein n=1 Tax=Amycolatopsis sp. GM8 TaxID=2896530 RepID=UPI001F3CA6DD|nr:hypothetical protein [Amycolatopsis sp. GM8]